METGIALPALRKHLLLKDISSIAVLQNLPEHFQGLGIVNPPNLLDEVDDRLLRTCCNFGGSTNEDLGGSQTMTAL